MLDELVLEKGNFLKEYMKLYMPLIQHMLKRKANIYALAFHLSSI